MFQILNSLANFWVLFPVEKKRYLLLSDQSMFLLELTSKSNFTFKVGNFRLEHFRFSF